jgi:hypothetical protein
MIGVSAMWNPFKRKEQVEPESFLTREEDWFGDLMDSLEYTPDYHRLNKYQSQLLFVYDELKKKHPQHKMIEGHTFPTPLPLPTGFTAAKFSLWKRPMGLETEAVALENEYIKPQVKGQVVEKSEGYQRSVYKIHDDLVPKTIIKGELHAVTPEAWKSLDTYKRNRVRSLRKRVKILIPNRFPNWNKDRDHQAQLFHLHEFHQVARVTIVTAWMYIGLPDYYDEPVDKGLYQPVNRYQHNGGRGFGVTDFYCFTHMDYVLGSSAVFEKEQMISIARERRKKDGFQLEWSTDKVEPVSKPGAMSRMQEIGKRFIGR